MNLGVQYYRAPFPSRSHWRDDLKRIRESGFNTVQLWVSWGWVEAHPGKFDYSDYDELVDIAADNGLGVVLSTIAEIQPNWIHRVVPDSEMIDSHGGKVISEGRCEHHFGLTPGGCTDNPEVWCRMREFIQQTGRHYAGCSHLRGWDIWNELRWNVHANAPVCYCHHTLAAFRKWLEGKYGDLDGLNRAWRRRYDCWEDVMPGYEPDRPYTEMMAFEEFITCRANRHAAMRYAAMREIDEIHPITAHAAQPSPLFFFDSTPGENFSVERGNDWELAKALDGIGCSSFPQWQNIDDADFGFRIDMVRSAAAGKKIWLSELQGGRASIGFKVFGDVRAAQQQRWLWNGVGSGADTILFWCWRDEVFGRESAGFGIAGEDGFAPERLAAMKYSGGVMEKNAELFDHYVIDDSQVGILFTPRSSYLAWAQEGHDERIARGLCGYARALTKLSIPLMFLESDNLNNIEQLKVIFLPRSIVIDDQLADQLLAFAEQGGTLVAESECGAFDSHGFYRHPSERFLTRTGIVERGRRTLPAESAVFNYRGENFELTLDQWLTPLVDSDELCVERPYGRGRIVYLAGYPGNGYNRQYCPGFEQLLKAIVEDSGICLPVEVIAPKPQEKEFIYIKNGHSKGRTLLFVFFPEGIKSARLRVAPELFPSGKAEELLSGEILEVAGDGEHEIEVHPGRFNIAVLAGRD